MIGIDSYHDSSARGKSAGGFVASVNATLTRCVVMTLGLCNSLCYHTVMCSLCIGTSVNACSNTPGKNLETTSRQQ